MGIRRRFSSLSGTIAGGSKSSAGTAIITSTPSLLTERPQENAAASESAEGADENANKNLANSYMEIAAGDGGFNMAANLEAFKQRCKALEAENRRLMTNQGNIIQDSNRRMDNHLEEIRQLNDQMECQKRENIELVRWANALEAENAKARELANEWQKIGQMNSQIVQREVQSFQSRVAQLDSKCAKLTAENVELKRLCLYLDKQRQHLWQQLATKNGQRLPPPPLANVDQNRREEEIQEREGGGGIIEADEDCPSEDAGCGGSSGALSSSSSSPSSSNSVNSLEAAGRMEQKGALKEEEQKAKATNIELDGEQEKTLQSICSEMQSSMLLGELEAKVAEEREKQQREEESKMRRPPIISPKILDHFENGDRKSIVPEQKSQKHRESPSLLNNSALCENYSGSNISASSLSSSSFGTTAQLGSSYCSSSDDTAILVLDMDDQMPTGTIYHQFDTNSSSCIGHEPLANCGLSGGLEVRELCTISEEEGDEEDGSRKMALKSQMTLLERLKFTTTASEGGYVEKEGHNAKGFNDEEEAESIRRRIAAIDADAAPNGQAMNGTISVSLCSSLLAQAGSMLASMVDEQQQMSRSAFVPMEEGGGGNRNSSTSTGSSSSSGAFSGTSNESCGGGDAGDGSGFRSRIEPTGGMEVEDNDDLPPQMPLILETHRLPSSIVISRPSSCIGGTNVPMPNPSIVPGKQSSTLPRAAGSIGNLPPSTFINGGGGSRPSSVIGSRSVAKQQFHPLPEYGALRASPKPLKKMTVMVNGQQQQQIMIEKHVKAPPVRIRVRPPPAAIQMRPKATTTAVQIMSNGNLLYKSSQLLSAVPFAKEADVTSL